MPYLLGTFCIVTAIHLSNVVRENQQDFSSKSRSQVYVHVAHTACPDGSPFDSRIEVQKGIPHLVRENCAELPVDKQRAISVIAESRGKLTYEGMPFLEANNDSSR